MRKSSFSFSITSNFSLPTYYGYFCQRYYDSQIGRFITLDRWTHLPDDERLFSYAKYLSWNNYQLKYTPQMTKIPKNNSFRRKSYTTSYDSLTNEINSIFPANPVLDFNDSVIYFRRMNNRKIFSHNILSGKDNIFINRYHYCYDNPLLYVDENGNGVFKDVILGLLWPSNIPNPTDPFDWPRIYEWWKNEIYPNWLMSFAEWKKELLLYFYDISRWEGWLYCYDLW